MAPQRSGRTRPGGRTSRPLERSFPLWAGSAWALLVLVTSLCFNHNDLRYIAWVSHFVPGDWNVYEAVKKVREADLIRLTYPPLAYWIIGAWIWIGKTLGGLFQYPHWDQHMAQNDFEYSLTFSRVEYLYLKSLYVPFLLGTAWLCQRMVTAGGKVGSPVFWLFLVQPIPFFICFYMGQFDIIPTFFCVAGVYLFSRGPSAPRVIAGFACMALGALMKNFPLVLAVMFLGLFLLRDKWRWKALAGWGVFVSIVALAFSAVWGPAFRESFLLLRHMEYLIKIGKYPMVTDLKVYLLAFLLIGLALTWSFKRGKGERSLSLSGEGPGRGMDAPLFAALSVAALALIFFDRRWMPQYVVWIVPWVLLFSLNFRGAWPEGQPLRTLIGRAPVVMAVIYFLSVFSTFPGNVDSNLFIGSEKGLTVGTFLFPYQVLFFLLPSAFFIVLLVLSVWCSGRIWVGAGWKGLRSPPSPGWGEVWTALGISGVVVFGSMLMVWLRP